MNTADILRAAAAADQFTEALAKYARRYDSPSHFQAVSFALREYLATVVMLEGKARRTIVFPTWNGETDVGISWAANASPDDVLDTLRAMRGPEGLASYRKDGVERIQAFYPESVGERLRELAATASSDQIGA